MRPPLRSFPNTRRKDDIGASSSQDKPPLGSPPNELPLMTEARFYLMEVQETFNDQKHKYEMFLKIMKDYKEKRIDVNAVVELAKILFKGHNKLILGFNTLLPKGFKITFDEEEAPLKKKVNYEGAMGFVNKIKKRFQHDEHVYKSFLNILNMFRKDTKDATEVYNEVSTLLEDHSDLLEELTRFIPGALAPHNAAQLLQNQAQPPHPEKNNLKKSLGSDEHLSRSIKREEKEGKHKRNLEAAKEKEQSKDKYMWKSIQELDLSDCECCTSSYRLLPPDYPIPSMRHRRKSEAAFLNDHWVSVPSGSEDYSFKHRRKNQYEQRMFRCEDDRFELDMLLESVESAAERAEELLNIIIEKKITFEGSFRIEDHFTALNLRCIERLYGDHGLDMIDIIRKNPAAALPVILTRLKQKKEEWTKCRERFNVVWADVYAKNHHKSLDHRSFYFKQKDSKSLSAKALVSEIKDLKEKCQKEDDVLLSISASYRQPIIPHLEYEYVDRTIHEDLFKLVKFSCEEICSTEEQIGKVLRLWANFLEVMLGAPPRAKGSNSVKDVVETKHHSAFTKGEANVSSDAISLVSRQQKFAADGDVYASSGVSKHAGTGVLNRDSLGQENCKDGELSLIGDSDDNFLLHEDCGLKATAEPEHSVEADGENDDDANDGNALETGADVLGTESIGENCSQDDNGKSESEGEAEGMESHLIKEDNGLLPSSERVLLSIKPLSKHVAAADLLDERKIDSRVFYGNDEFYVLFRLHQILYERILSAKTYCMQDTSSLDPYARFMSALFSLLNGSAENSKFEDECRAIIGNQSYVLFTLEKLIHKLVKQLQAVVADDMDNKLLRLYEYERSRKPGREIDLVYYDNARILLHDENIYRFECSSFPPRLVIQLMDNIIENPDAYEVSLDPTFASYLQNYFLSNSSGKKGLEDIVLQRIMLGYTGLDDLAVAFKAMEGVEVSNGLECTMSCSSYKISYVPDTEDFFHRKKKQTKSKNLSQKRIERFQKFLAASR